MLALLSDGTMFVLGGQGLFGTGKRWATGRACGGSGVLAGRPGAEGEFGVGRSKALWGYLRRKPQHGDGATVLSDSGGKQHCVRLSRWSRSVAMSGSWV